VSPNAALWPADLNRPESKTLWDLDPELLPHLHEIVAIAADAGSGAGLVVSARGEAHVLVNVRGDPQSWSAVASTVLEQDEAVFSAGMVGMPVRGPLGVRGALLLSHDSTIELPLADLLLRAHAARLEAALAHTATKLATMEQAADVLLSMLLEHDPETVRHARMVRRLIRPLGHAVGLAPRALWELELAALLHDIGKVAIDRAVLQKAGSLSVREWTLMRQHPSTGERIVRAMPILDVLCAPIRHHHEQWDGEGYPDRLRSEAIPLGARLLALADAYEVLRTGRRYRISLSLEETLAELRASAGTQLDPALVELLPALSESTVDWA
jgi:HD-GYP domain-containing protein (c-di-GMP phosphodiesterase class II)